MYPARRPAADGRRGCFDDAGHATESGDAAYDRSALAVTASTGGPWRPTALSGGGLEELDRVTGRILGEDLLAARARHDLAAERQPGRAEARHFVGDVLHDEVDAVPSTG